MGRIKTQMIKRASLKLMATHADMFTSDFTQNKVAIGILTRSASKKIRNILAGYVTRLTEMRIAKSQQ